ncbi:MAG: hypothetical protein HC838_00770 [Spirulinaceae cyanobacterium RM2_2_10]|nr:hypothetical protein [Spirulinaceae cyanobacterium SM2_1_0]NJO18884.1 hypothetical protein [Spirulinaceae cyanobacterium RM2_2_10]
MKRSTPCFWLTAIALLLAQGSASAQASLQLSQVNAPSSPSEDVRVETADSPRFTCQLYQGQPTVMYTPAERPDQAYAWAVPQALGGGWTPQRRCEVISQRLEDYRPDGMIEMRTAMENNYDIVCVTTEINPGCRIVLTVPPGQDPLLTRDRVFQNLTLADSGQVTDGVYTYTGSGSILDALGNVIGVDPGTLFGGGDRRPAALTTPGAIPLRPFLAPSDGGSGTQLQRLPVVPQGGGLRLNPDRFR